LLQDQQFTPDVTRILRNMKPGARLKPSRPSLTGRSLKY